MTSRLICQGGIAAAFCSLGPAAGGCCSRSPHCLIAVCGVVAVRESGDGRRSGCCKVAEEFKEFENSHAEVMQPARRHAVCDVGLQEARPSRFGTGAWPMSTALVPLAPRERRALSRSTSIRPRADFLAQLIATSAQLPQTRLRRRAEPDVAIAAYGANDRSPPRVGGALKRSL